MSSLSSISRAVRLALSAPKAVAATVACGLCVATTSAWGQAGQAAGAAPSTEDVITVTGSRLRRDTFNSVSPVQLITREQVTAAGFSSGEGIALMDEVATAILPPGTGYEWTAMSYQENIVGNQMLYVFALANLVTSFRANAPHVRLEIDRVKAESLKVPVGEVFSALSSYLGSSFVNRFNKFGLTLMVFLQADSQYRTQPRDILLLQVRTQDGQMVPIGAIAELK